ncbi:hypothetical protein GCM10020000_50380 [Streptomyces olivoverticillatus]
MVTLDELSRLDIGKFKRAAEAWGSMSNRASEARRRVDSDMVARVHDTQQGEAANTAVSSMMLLSRNYQYIHTECGLVQRALSGLAEELTAPQRKLKQALEDAEHLKFTVKEDGSVGFPRSASSTLPVPMLPQPARPGNVLLPSNSADPNEIKAREIADRIGSAIDEANEIDGRYARALASLGTNDQLDKTAPPDTLAQTHLTSEDVEYGRPKKIR